MSYKKILIVNPFGIGDVLFTTPLISQLKEELPDACVSYWSNERTRPALENNPHLDKIFSVSRGDLKKIFASSKIKGIKAFLRLIKEIRSERFDLAFDLSLDHRYGLLLLLLGIKKRIGFDFKGRGKFLTDKIKIEGYTVKHMCAYYADLLQFLDIKPATMPMALYPAAEQLNKAKLSLRNLGVEENDLIVAVAPGGGASWGKDARLKHWPPVRFAHLADKIIDAFHAKILLLGDEQEEDIADTIISNMRNKVIDLTGKTNLEELIATISLLKILITNDGGPMHMAVAQGIKTISLFGPVDETVYGPYPPSPNHIVMNSKPNCRPCYKNFKLTPCLKNKECLESISIDDIYANFKKLCQR